MMPFAARSTVDGARRCLHDVHCVLEPAEHDVPVGAQVNDRWSHGAMDDPKILQTDQSTSLTTSFEYILWKFEAMNSQVQRPMPEGACAVLVPASERTARGFRRGDGA